MEYKIYTDGSCNSTTRVGAYGAVLVMEDGSHFDIVPAKAVNNTTNNRMEMTAVWGAMLVFEDMPEANGSTLIIHSDSQYVINGLTSWYPGWALNGFRNKQGKEVKNVKLWKELYATYKRVNPQLVWVRGHVKGEKWNNYIDVRVGEAQKRG